MISRGNPSSDGANLEDNNFAVATEVTLLEGQAKEAGASDIDAVMDLVKAQHEY
ncbi:MAG: hypothetical protein L0H73_08780 [Nitrococcus sp.]|nr:hypothetical protein [Nitrococcus sp.]